MRYELSCKKCKVKAVADKTETNKEVITAFRKEHEECGDVKIVPTVGVTT